MGHRSPIPGDHVGPYHAPLFGLLAEHGGIAKLRTDITSLKLDENACV